jgi:hypothetical protein
VGCVRCSFTLSLDSRLEGGRSLLRCQGSIEAWPCWWASALEKSPNSGLGIIVFCALSACPHFSVVVARDGHKQLWGKVTWVSGAQLRLFFFHHLVRLNGGKRIIPGHNCQSCQESYGWSLKEDCLSPFVLGWESLLVNKYILIMRKD